MSAKTKIVVLHMKELIYTGIFAALGILFVVLLVIMFLPDKEDSEQPAPDTPPVENDGSLENMPASSGEILYIPGVYTTELLLSSQSVDVEVIVSQEAITSIRLVNLSDTIATMYPLLQPTLDSICEQVYEKQSLDEVTYSAESKYTSLVLLEAIRNSLDKALVENAAPPENKD